MRILHTSDWHLGATLGGYDRTEELFAQVERVCAIAEDRRVDVLLVAGDIFDCHRRQRLHEVTQRLARTLAPRVRAGLRVILLPGNHDFRDHFQMMRAMMELETGEPERVRIAEGYDKFEWDGVQFRILPYPDRELLERYQPSFADKADLDGRNFSLSNILCDLLRDVTAPLDPKKPSVLAAHLLIKGVTTPSQKELSYNEDICLGRENLPMNVSYIALGHIHQPQPIDHVVPCWYSGSLDRMDLGERKDNKRVVLVEIDDSGLATVTDIPLDATPFDDIQVPASELENFAESYADRERAYVRVTIDLTPEDDQLKYQRLARELFPRCLDVRFTGAYAAATGANALENPTDYVVTVNDHLDREFKDDPDLPELKRLAQKLIQEAQDALTSH
jgi:exonuclease SbcD